MTDLDVVEEELGTAGAGLGDTGSKENDRASGAEMVDESDAQLPAPLSNGAYRKVLKELPDGPRVAAETCVQFWKVGICSLAASLSFLICPAYCESLVCWMLCRTCGVAGQEVPDGGACCLSEDNISSQACCFSTSVCSDFVMRLCILDDKIREHNVDFTFFWLRWYFSGFGVIRGTCAAAQRSRRGSTTSTTAFSEP